MSDRRLGPAPAVEGPFSAAEFRRVLGGFASGVVVVTSMDGDEPVGMTCQSFFSLSMDPPLVAFSPARSSSTYPRIRRSGKFAVNILEAGQEDLGLQFARSGGDKWRGVEWRPGPNGSPLLDGVLGWVDCELEAEHEAGDHFITVGRVQSLDRQHNQHPLLFFSGAFGQMHRPPASGERRSA